MTKTQSPWIGLLVGVLGSSALAFADSQKSIEVKSVQEILSREKASWQAKDNWLTELSRSDLKKMMGVQAPPQGQLDFESYSPNGMAIPTPPLDWRDRFGVNWLGPMMNQGNCGSCVAFAAVATLEAQVSISAGLPWLHPSFSPQALFACGGGGCETGWRPESATRYLKSSGVPDEACLPYTSGSTAEDVSCNEKCSDYKNRTFKIVGSSSPTSYGGNIEAVKKALKNGPLITTLMVYADFVSYSSGVYKHVTGESLGGHAISLIGYDDKLRAWLIRNSWGTEWGEKGYGWVSWDDRSGVGSDTWAMQVATPQGYLSVATPSDRQYVSGQFELTAQSQGLKTEQDIQFHLKGQDGKEITNVPAPTRLDTTQMKEGRYEIYAESSSSGLKSQVREFFVINSEPKMSITFSGAGVDLNAPLKGRPEFIVQAQMTPVPIEHLEFRAYDSTGKLVASKANDQVLPSMKMGWRTTAVPNGTYRILFYGETKYLGKTYTVESPALNVTVKN